MLIPFMVNQNEIFTFKVVAEGLMAALEFHSVTHILCIFKAF